LTDSEDRGSRDSHNIVDGRADGLFVRGGDQAGHLACDLRGLREKITTYDNPTVGSGSEVNEVLFEYNHLGQPTREYPEHAGAKDGNTLYVEYAYDTTASGGAYTKGPRPTSVRYPNGRRTHLNYGASTDRDRFTYGYDRASNRLYRENTVANGKDEFYTWYDGLARRVRKHLDSDSPGSP
jgi:hypothetical protein